MTTSSTNKADESFHVHPTAVVAASAQIGPGTHIWNWAQVRERARVGAMCVISKGVYIDSDVSVGNLVKIQNNASLYHGLTVEDGVFIGPHVTFTNDKVPRAINADGTAKGVDDWVVTPTLVRHGASVGAGAVVVCGITIGRFALVAAGAVVTHDVPDQGLVAGVPARLIGYVCACGQRLSLAPDVPPGSGSICAACGRETTIQ